MDTISTGLRLGLMTTAFLAIASCDRMGGLDLDMRGGIGDNFDTSTAVARAVAAPPRPDARGVVSYPNYQVVVAGRNDTVEAISSRVGLPAQEIARFNGLPLGVPLRAGEIVALPRRVAEPTPTPAAPVRGNSSLAMPGAVTTAPLEERANSAIIRAETAGTPARPEPVRHQVQRGETAFSIARRYNVPLEALRDWNALPADMTVRVGQYLLIPTVTAAAPPANVTSAPGAGSVAPEPPSAAEPLPEEDATQAPPDDVPASPDLAEEATAESASGARLALPVNGPIIRAFSRGTNDGIDISASPGAPVRAADGGVVAAITRDTDQIPIIVLRHEGNLLTVYAGVDDVSVEKGDTVARGETIARIRNTSPSFLHFEVRQGFDSVDPVSFLE
ncbi:murein DD-endopeptidase MepM/ murein hydrolase activator NlpD [Palleronia aestuarii]|uniref:Murein DD-endopeptidase MepM/ murein hydrolase activator NlpD n=1 Tax=Palleronia aestuarii TaxID=568105 RepID=A0A2W7ND59_9RHOB|nr:M23 family metallopeptidase [Palleronia aestuarii]PZX18315.1 murein DD-endopeptidase MepM/ murein hydrolase activator NlpD [Palleronia aestuarii]